MSTMTRTNGFISLILPLYRLRTLTLLTLGGRLNGVPLRLLGGFVVMARLWMSALGLNWTDLKLGLSLLSALTRTVSLRLSLTGVLAGGASSSVSQYPGSPSMREGSISVSTGTAVSAGRRAEEEDMVEGGCDGGGKMNCEDGPTSGWGHYV